MIKLAAFDIDGTLFDEETQRFPASAVEALGELGRRDVVVVAATGRPPASALVLRRAGIFPDYFVCSNGHLLLDREGAVLGEEGFSPQLAQAVWDYCREGGIPLLWKYPDCTCVYRSCGEFERIFDKNRRVAPDAGRPNVRYDDLTAHLRRAPNGGCLGCSPQELERFNRAFQGRCLGVDINGRTADLMLWGVDKRSGLARLLELLRIPPGDCIAFGDNRNDLGLLRFVGIGVAMGNGEAELKEQSDFVTRSAGEDGILLGLRHFDLI